MIQPIVNIEEVIDVPEDFYNNLENLRIRIEDYDIPKWILIPNRLDEHATGMAWSGVLNSVLYSPNARRKIDTRIAWDTKNRERSKSNTTDVPDNIKKPIQKATDQLSDVDMCILRIEFNEQRDIEGMQVGFRIEETDSTHSSEE